MKHNQKVLVVDIGNKPLAPCHPARARQLIRNGKARIIKRDPFTIRLNRKFPKPPAHITELVQQGATFVVSNSGGKDSQAMQAYIRSFVPAEQILVIHAHLPEVEWDGVTDHVRRMSYGVQSVVVQAKKTFFEMVDQRQKWPSPQFRQCTSDLKRSPIEKAVRHFIKDKLCKIIVSCIGLRAEESSSRARHDSFKLNERNSKAGRQWYEWLPVHGWTETQVWNVIQSVGQHRHWAYNEGMTRLSCSFCIMSSRKDLQTAARLRPALFQKYVRKERELDFTFLMPGKGKTRKFLDEIVGDDNENTCTDCSCIRVQ